MGRCKDCGKWIANSSQSDGRESLPCFFKVLIGNFSKKLWIPPRFAEYLITGGAILRGPSGNIWNVRLKRKDNRFFFGKGWENFARHHQLNTTDFLIFSYDGVLEFNVLIFDRSGCLREDAFFAKNLENADENGEQNKRQDAGESSVEVIAQPRAANNGTSKESHVDYISVESGETSSQQKQGKLSKCSSKVVPKPDEAAEVCWQKQTGTSSLSKRRRATTEEKSRFFMLASSFHSRHPFFIFSMLRSCVSNPFKLRIPSQFAKAHLVCKKTKVILRNAMTGEWPVTCLHYGKKGLRLSAGWPAFVRAHSLVEGDVCAFELLDKERRQLDGLDFCYASHACLTFFRQEAQIWASYAGKCEMLQLLELPFQIQKLSINYQEEDGVAIIFLSSDRVFNLTEGDDRKVRKNWTVTNLPIACHLRLPTSRFCSMINREGGIQGSISPKLDCTPW